VLRGRQRIQLSGASKGTQVPHGPESPRRHRPSTCVSSEKAATRQGNHDTIRSDCARTPCTDNVNTRGPGRPHPLPLSPVHLHGLSYCIPRTYDVGDGSAGSYENTLEMPLWGLLIRRSWVRFPPPSPSCSLPSKALRPGQSCHGRHSSRGCMALMRAGAMPGPEQIKAGGVDLVERAGQVG